MTEERRKEDRREQCRNCKDHSVTVERLRVMGENMDHTKQCIQEHDERLRELEKAVLQIPLLIQSMDKRVKLLEIAILGSVGAIGTMILGMIGTVITFFMLFPWDKS